MKKLFLFLISFSLILTVYAKPKIGDTRTFERFKGKWTVEKIIKDKNAKTSLRLDNRQCPHCGEHLYPIEEYTFNRIEVLTSNGKKLHLGISDNERYIILEDYLHKNQIKKLMGEK